MSDPPKLTDWQIADEYQKWDIASGVSMADFARQIESIRDAQWLKYLKSNGWRQCAEGQGVSQFCQQAEELAKKLQVAESQRDDSLFALAIANAKASEPAPVDWAAHEYDGTPPSESAPKECHGCRMAEKYIKQLREENHKLLSAPSATTLERDTIAVNLMRLTQGLDKHTARLIADQCIELARQPAPKREWVGLTDDHMDTRSLAFSGYSPVYITGYEAGMESAQAKLKELNHDN